MVMPYRSFTLYDMVNNYAFSLDDIFGDYPIWDEDFRDTLNGWIYSYFEYRECASETPENFANQMYLKMIRTMSQVNDIAKTYFDRDESEVLKWSDTGSVTTDMETTRTPDLVDSSTTESESKATALMSDTPQTQLSGTENYMTQLNESGSAASGTTTATSTGTETNEGTTTTTTHDGNAAEQLARWLAAYPDVLGYIFTSLEPLFMQVY